MKWPKFEPSWALIGGALVAPAACALNSLVLQLIFGGVSKRLFSHLTDVWFSSLILTFPLGWITMRLMEIWQKGNFTAARTLGLGFGLFSITLQFFLWATFGYSWRAPEIGALAIPFLWSISLLLFAVFARPRKN